MKGILKWTLKSSTRSLKIKNSLNDLSESNTIYVDSNIFIHDATNHPKYDTSRSIFLNRVESGEITGVPSVLSINETVHKLAIIELSSKLKKKPVSIIPLIKKTPSRLMSNDAMHVATMKRHGITNIATNDLDFERVEWIKIWKP